MNTIAKDDSEERALIMAMDHVHSLMTISYAMGLTLVGIYDDLALLQRLGPAFPFPPACRSCALWWKKVRLWPL